MSDSTDTTRGTPRRSADARSRGVRIAAGIVVAVLLGSCGDGPKKATQVAARVNDDELSVHQINFVLQRTSGIAPDRAADARREVLERLIDQELTVQQARQSKLDRDPEIMQRLEAARREVLSRAYLERVASRVGRPDAAEVRRFFDENPGLFSQRRVWRLNEIVLPGRPADWARLSRELEPVRTAAQAADLLRRRGIDTAVATDVARASEGIPLEVLPKFATLKDGEVAIFQNGPQVVIAEIRSSRSAPLDANQAGPAIEQFILNRRRNEAVQAEIRRLRDASSIEYRGEFATAASSPGAAPADAVAPSAAPGPATGGPGAAPDAAKGAGDGAARGVIEKGLGGLK